MLRYLLKPYPCNVEPRFMMVQSLAVSIFIFFFLFIFQPFEISSKPDEHVLNLSIMYSLITLGCSLVMTLGVPKLFPSIFEDLYWNVLSQYGDLNWHRFCKSQDKYDNRNYEYESFFPLHDEINAFLNNVIV